MQITHILSDIDPNIVRYGIGQYVGYMD
jgi:hypothetical protein